MDDIGYVSPWWQASLIPAVWDVAGVTCFSLSLWHVWALENVGNPYVCGGARDRDAASGLLLFAALDYTGGKRMMLDAAFRAGRMARMARRLSFQPWAEVDAACVDYVTTCTRQADREIPISEDGKVKRGRMMSAPWIWHILHHVTGGDPARFVAGWDTPYIVARCLYDVWGETQGDKSLVDPVKQRGIDAWCERQQKAAGV